LINFSVSKSIITVAKIKYNRIILFICLNYFNILFSQVILTDSIPSYQKNFNKAVQYIDSNKFDKALPILKAVIKEKKDFGQAYIKTAYIKIKQKNYKEAEKDLLKAEKIKPNDFEIFKLKGINFYFVNKFDESKFSLDSAFEISKREKIDDWELLYYRALLMFKGKSYKSAQETLESVTDLNPKCAEAYYLKGEIRFVKKEYNYALKELNEAINKLPVTKPDYNFYKLRAKTKFEIQDYKGAVNDWNVYIDGIPNEEEALISRAAAKINCKEFTGAIVDLDEAIKLNSKNPISYCYRGVAKSENKAFKEALDDYNTAIKLKFDYAAAFFNRAATKMAIKDKIGACDDLNKADGLGNLQAARIIDKYCK